jgi:hypothetical protein
MTRRLRKRLIAVLVLALLAGGTAVAAVTAAKDSARPHTATSALGVAAAYLGVSEAQLRKDVRGGESLAQVAQSTGHSPQGLIEAIVAARRPHLEAQLSHLKQHVTEQVTRSGASRALAGGRAGGGPAAAAASYLGVSKKELRAKLRAGETLAQLAESTPGRSRAGLIAALLDVRRQRLDAKVSQGELTSAQEQKRLARAEARIGARVDRPFTPGARGARAAARGQATRGH